MCWQQNMRSDHIFIVDFKLTGQKIRNHIKLRQCEGTGTESKMLLPKDLKNHENIFQLCESAVKKKGTYWEVTGWTSVSDLPHIAFIEWRMTNKGQIIKNKDQLDCKSDGGVVDWSSVVYECMSVCMSCDGPVQGAVLPQVPVKSNELLQFACSLCPLVCCIKLHSCCSVFSHFALGKPFSLLGNEQMRWGK